MENMGMNAGGPADEVKNLLLQGFRAAKEGRREEAYQLFCDVVARDPNNEYGWLYRAATTDSRSEAYVCLEKVLSINPNNVKAQRGLERIREEQQAEGEEEGGNADYGFAPPVAEPASGKVGSADVVSGFPSRGNVAPPPPSQGAYPYDTEGPQAPAYPGYPGANQDAPQYSGYTEQAAPAYPSYGQSAPPPGDNYNYGGMDTQPRPNYDYYQNDQGAGYPGNEPESPQEATRNRLRGKGKKGRNEEAAMAGFGAGEATDLDQQGRTRQRRTRSALLIPLILLLLIALILGAFLFINRNNTDNTVGNTVATSTVSGATTSGAGTTGGTGATSGTTAAGSTTAAGNTGATTAAGGTTGGTTAAGGNTGATTAASGNTGATTAAGNTGATTAAGGNTGATTAAGGTNTTPAANTTAAGGNPGGGTAAPTKPILYTIRSGDNLTRIASTYATSADAIRAANRYTNPITGDRIFAGNRVIIPVSRPDFRGSGHVVAQGETLDSIAAKYGTTADAIVKLNGLAGPTDIKEGDPLLIP